MICDDSNCYLPGRVSVMTWYLTIQLISRNVTPMILCVMVQTLSRTCDCDDTGVNSKSDLRTGD
jgi:hypothetical protein